MSKLNYSTSAKPLSWSATSRLRFIDFQLKWKGKINRQDLIDYFTISVPQASLDMAEYLKRAPNNMSYDHRTKAYLRNDTFNSLYPDSSSVDAFIDQIQNNPDFRSDVGDFCETIPQLGRKQNDVIFEKIVLAIIQGHSIDIEYQSMTRDTPSERTIIPKNIIHDGERWHVRAYCMQKERFLDFLISRILVVDNPRLLSISLPEDLDWEKKVSLVIMAHQGLSSAQKAAVEYDYGMTNHVLTLSCRKAHLYYVLKRYRLLFKAVEPTVQLITLKNYQEIYDLLTAREKKLLSDL